MPLILTGCLYSTQALLDTDTQFPIQADVTNLESQVIQDAAWIHSDDHILRKLQGGEFMYVALPANSNVASISFERIRGNFYALTSGSEAAEGREPFYTYQLIHFNPNTRYIYHWSLMNHRSLRTHQDLDLGANCVRHSGRTGITARNGNYGIPDRSVFLEVMRSCVDLIVAQHIAPTNRYVMR